MNQIKALERLALDAHRRGVGWECFWTEHADAVRACEPWCRAKYRKIFSRLLAIVVCGDCSGMTAVGDDVAQVPISDTTTAARCLWLTPEVQRG